MTDRNENVLFSALAETGVLFPENKKAVPVEIVQSIAEEVEFGKIRKRRKNWREKPVEDWLNNDLFNYFMSAFYRKFGYNVECALFMGRQNMLRVGENLKKAIGSWPKSEVSKEYIDWFVEEQIPKLLSKYSIFKINFMYHQKNIADFVEKYGLAELREIQLGKEEEEQTTKVIFEGTLPDFVCNNGFMYSLAYFKNSGKTANECCSIISNAIQMIEKANRYDEFAASTRDNGPYPNSLKYRQLDKVFEKVAKLSGRRVSMLRIEFSDTAQPVEFNSSL